MITDCDLLQISQIENWGKIYGVYYPEFVLINLPFRFKIWINYLVPPIDQ